MLDSEEAAVRRGRPRDTSRDAHILDAALELLAEVGYDGLTVDAVAARAQAGKATIYRRWESKDALVLSCMGCVAPRPDLVDTGTLRADLLAIFGEVFLDRGEQRLAVMSGLIPAMRHSEELRAAFEREFIGPRQAALRAVFERARDRGEVGPDVDIELLLLLTPALVIHRQLFTTAPIDRQFVERVIDHVVLPLAAPPASSGDKP